MWRAALTTLTALLAVWWDVAAAKNLKAADFGSTTLANLRIGVADDPAQKGSFAIYFFGFET